MMGPMSMMVSRMLEKMMVEKMEEMVEKKMVEMVEKMEEMVEKMEEMVEKMKMGARSPPRGGGGSERPDICCFNIPKQFCWGLSGVWEAFSEEWVPILQFHMMIPILKVPVMLPTLFCFYKKIGAFVGSVAHNIPHPWGIFLVVASYWLFFVGGAIAAWLPWKAPIHSFSPKKQNKKVKSFDFLNLSI